MTQEEKIKYSTELAQPYCNWYGCEKVRVKVYLTGGIIKFYGECIEWGV